MPLDPRTWSPGDPLIPTYLNGDLNSIQGKQFWPTGTRFHARRPLYRSTPAGVVSVGANAWSGIFPIAPNQGSNVIADSSADYGAHMDPTFTGTIADAIAWSNGNAQAVNGASGKTIGGGGGWYLMSAFTPMAGPASFMFRNNIASGWNGATPNAVSTGTNQQGNASHDTVPMVVDLVLSGGGSYFPVVNNTSGSAVPLRANGTGSGEACYWQAHWASVALPYGFTASLAPAPKPSWLTSDSVTSAMLNGNTGIRDVLRVLNMPPMARLSTVSSTSVPHATDTLIQCGTSPAGTIDTYGAWSGFAASTYTVPFSGLYLCYGVVPFQSSASSLSARAGININGTTYWGPYSPGSASYNLSCAKLQIFDLRAGDTIQLRGLQNSGGTLGTATNYPPTLVILWLGNAGTVPSPVPNVPDLSYRWKAGNQAPLTPLNGNLANDLNFLVNKPYLLTYQQTSQPIPQSATTAMTMDTARGIIHATNGDNYGGWSGLPTSTSYLCQQAGWYMAVGEAFLPAPSLTSTPSVLAAFQVSTNPSGATWDWYQHQNPAAGVAPNGAAALGYYYLRPGDAIQFGCQVQDYASGSVNTHVAGVNSHFELVWISE